MTTTITYADTKLIPEKMPATNVVDPNHHVSKQTIEEIENWNKLNNPTKLKPRFRLFVFDKVTNKTLDKIRTNTADKWRNNRDDHQDIYVVIGYNDHTIQTEYTATLDTIINDQTINDWHQAAIKGLSKNDLTAGMHAYIQAMNRTLTPVKNTTIQSKTHNQIFIGLLCISTAVVLALIGLISFLLYRWGDSKKRLKRSNYSYRGKDKLYPDMKGFIHNESWTEKRLRKYIQKIQKQ